MSDMNKSKRQIRDDSWNFDETTGWLIRSEGKEVWRREIKSSVWNGLSSRCPLASIPCQVNGWIEAKGPGMKSALGGLQNPMHNRRNSWDPLPAQVPVQPLLSLSSSSSWQRSMRALLPHSIAPTPPTYSNSSSKVLSDLMLPNLVRLFSLYLIWPLHGLWWC